MSELADLLERFRRGAELLAVATTGVAGAELDFKPKEGTWSIRQIVCHVADAETVGVMRLRQVIAEDHPTLQAFNGDLWADRLDYAKRKLSQALETFRRLRTENYELLKELPEDVFARSGTHTENGVMTLRQVVEYHAEHVDEHVQQIQRNRAAYREHRARQAAQPAT
jgi:hypothetical protein